MELQEEVPHYIEQVRLVPNRIVGWLPTEMCANTTLANIPKVWWNGRHYACTEPTNWLLAEYLWACGYYG